MQSASSSPVKGTLPAAKRQRRDSKAQKQQRSDTPSPLDPSPRVSSEKEDAKEQDQNANNQDETIAKQPADAVEEEEEAEEDEVVMDPDYEAFMRDKAAETTANMRRLLEAMSEDQQRRFETYRSAAFPRAAIKRIVSQNLGQAVNEKLAVMVAGVAKMYVNQLVETARDVMEKKGEDGPILPMHLREANRRLRGKQTVSSSRYKPRFFM